MRLFGSMYIFFLAFSSFSFAEKPDLIIGYKNVYDAEHSHDAEKIAVATNLGIFIFETESMKLLSYRLFDNGLKYLDWSPNDNYIFASNPEIQENYILDANSLETTAIVSDSIEFHIESSYASTCIINYDNTVTFDSADEYLYYLNIPHLKRINIHDGIDEIVFTPDNKTLFAFGFLENNQEIWLSTYDQFLYIYDLETKETRTKLSPMDMSLPEGIEIFGVSPSCLYTLYHSYYQEENLWASVYIIDLNQYTSKIIWSDVSNKSYRFKYIIIDDDNIFTCGIHGYLHMYNVTTQKRNTLITKPELRDKSFYSQFGTPVSRVRSALLYNGKSTSPTLNEYIWSDEIDRKLLPLYDNNLLTFKNTANNHLVLEHPFKHIDVASQDRIDNVTEEFEYEFREPSAFSDDDSLFASATDDGNVLIWDMGESGFLTKDGIDGTENSNHINFSPNNHYLALARNQIALYDRQRDWKEKNILDGHTGAIYSLDFAMDSSHMVSGGEDGKLIVWDLSTLEGETILQIDQPIKFISYLSDN